MPSRRTLAAIAAIITAATAYVLLGSALAPGQRSGQAVLDNRRQDAIKLMVAVNGVHRITLQQLQTAGLDIDFLDSDNMHLSQSGTTVPFHIRGDSLIFYGQESLSRYSRYRPYILQTGLPGTVMTSIYQPKPSTVTHNTAKTRLHFEENLVYDSRARNAAESYSVKDEPWFWATIQVGEKVPITFNLPSIDEKSGANLKAHFWGASRSNKVDGDHDLNLVLNDVQIDSVIWDGENPHTSSSIVPAQLLHSGTNSLVLDNSGPGAVPIDIMRLDWIEISFHGQAEALNDRLMFLGEGQTVELEGFLEEPLLYDVTNPDKPLRLLAETIGSEEGYQITAGDGRTIIAVGPNGFHAPSKILPLRSSHLVTNSNQADLIIITTEALAPDLSPLVTAREAQGLAVVLASVEEIADVFADGESGPVSINLFLHYALSEWAKPSPQYLLLVGEATYDYRNYLGPGPANIVPTPMVPIRHGGETVSDSRLADVDGDYRPEIAVGRWPVDSSDDVADLIKRTLAYERGPVSENALFIADGTSPEFSNLSDKVLSGSNLLLANVERLYDVQAVDVASAWEAGSWLVTYSGHGSIDRWGKDALLTTDSVSILNNDLAPPITVHLTCLTGYYAHPQIVSLSESMLLHENGPVLIVSASSLTISTDQEPFGISLIQALQDPAVTRAGDALQIAKLGLEIIGNNALREISDTFNLIGDPSTTIMRP